jgi:hypothetical protein
MPHRVGTVLPRYSATWAHGGWEWNTAAERAGREALGREVDLGPVLRQRPEDVRQHLAECYQSFSTQLFHRRIRANGAQVEAQAAADRIRNVQGKRTLRCLRIRCASLICTRDLYGAVDGVDAGRVKADVEQADAALSERQAEYADEKGAVELDVRQAYVDLQVATEQIAVAIENRKVAAEILTQSLDRFAAGVTNSVEVVQSQETVASAERDYVSTLFSLNLARISLARATGQAEQFIPNMLKGN